jgi:hypothetical protein
MKKETSCINSRVILDYVDKQSVGDWSGLLQGLDDEIDEIPDIRAFLRDHNNWVPCGVISKLFERVRVILNDDMAAYKIARYGAENIALGYGQGIIVKAFWSVRKGLKSLQKINGTGARPLNWWQQRGMKPSSGCTGSPKWRCQRISVFTTRGLTLLYRSYGEESRSL